MSGGSRYPEPEPGHLMATWGFSVILREVVPARGSWFPGLRELGAFENHARRERLSCPARHLPKQFGRSRFNVSVPETEKQKQQRPDDTAVRTKIAASSGCA